MGTLNAFRKNVYSQNGEDGVIAELVRRIGIVDPGTHASSRPVCVEFGAGDGRSLSNTLQLIERGWRGVYIEQNAASTRECWKLAETYPAGQVTVVHGMVGYSDRDSLDHILQQHAPDIAPKPFSSDGRDRFDIDVLSIDIDSYDLQVWRAVTVHRAKIVVIEINSSIPIGVLQEHSASSAGAEAGVSKQGASFSSMLALGREKDYTLVCHTGNLIFVDSTFVDKVGLTADELAHPETMFDDMWVKCAEQARAAQAQVVVVQEKW
jgi:hypothetical protein